MTGAPLLELDGVSVTFPGRGKRQPVRALDGVSLQLHAGETLAVVGGSGSGKTTAARCAIGAVRPDAGRVLVGGQDLAGVGRRGLRTIRRDLQLVYQDPYESLDPRFRVRQTVEEPLLVHGIGDRAERQERVAVALEQAGLDPERHLERRPHELSGGERQRVSIAAALVLRPAAMIADEPVSMLDVSVRWGILALLRQLCADGIAILVITHDLSTVGGCADRVAVMREGRVVETGDARTVLAAPQDPYTRELVAAIPALEPPRVAEGT